MSPPVAPRVTAGVFVGGAGRRMGGRAKGLLEAPGGGTLVDRLLRVLTAAGVADVVLVGRHAAYASFGIEAIDDEPPGIGPIGGLAALLRRAGAGHALAIACDMPFVSGSLVTRILRAPPAAVVAPRRAGLWEPLVARYDAPRVLPTVRRRIADGSHSLQPLLLEVGAAELPPDPTDTTELRDWDSPDDVES